MVGHISYLASFSCCSRRTKKNGGWKENLATRVLPPRLQACAPCWEGQGRRRTAGQGRAEATGKGGRKVMGVRSGWWFQTHTMMAENTAPAAPPCLRPPQNLSWPEPPCPHSRSQGSPRPYRQGCWGPPAPGWL